MKENKLNRKLKVGEFAKIISGPYEGEIVISIYAANLIVSLTNGKNTWDIVTGKQIGRAHV